MFAYYCSKGCGKSHNYRLDFSDVVLNGNEVWVKAHGESCQFRHWVWKVLPIGEYERECKARKIMPQEERW